MIDIDFRYVMRECTDWDCDDSSIGTVRTIKVLQWRKKVYMPVPNQPDLPAGVPPICKPEPEWTDWQDVRTEEE